MENLLRRDNYKVIIDDNENLNLSAHSVVYNHSDNCASVGITFFVYEEFDIFDYLKNVKENNLNVKITLKALALNGEDSHVVTDGFYKLKNYNSEFDVWQSTTVMKVNALFETETK